jgi:hypothetical protein
MRKVLSLAVIAMFLVVGFGVQGAVASQKSKSPKLTRWHGTIVRINKDESSLDVRRKGNERTIHYDSSTTWTTGDGSTSIQLSDVKEGDDAVCIGKFNEKKQFVATQINVRPK